MPAFFLNLQPSIQKYFLSNQNNCFSVHKLSVHQFAKKKYLVFKYTTCPDKKNQFLMPISASIDIASIYVDFTTKHLYKLQP